MHEGQSLISNYIILILLLVILWIIYTGVSFFLFCFAGFRKNISEFIQPKFRCLFYPFFCCFCCCSLSSICRWSLDHDDQLHLLLFTHRIKQKQTCIYVQIESNLFNDKKKNSENHWMDHWLSSIIIIFKKKIVMDVLHLYSLFYFSKKKLRKS